MAADASHVVGNTYRALVPEGMRRRVSTQISREARARVKRQLTTVVAPADRIGTRRVHRRLQRSYLSRAIGTRRLPGGRLAQVHEGLTPGETLRHNLEAITTALEANGVTYFAVPALNDRHASLAVPANHRLKVYRALAALFQETPGAVQQVLPTPKRSGSQYGTGVKFSRLDGAKVIRVSWLRSDPTGGLVIGSSVGVEIEFWNVAKGFLLGPRPNRVMRKVPVGEPESMAGLRHFTQFCDPQDTGDVQVRTRACYTAPRADEITFPVDAVCLWEAGQDEALLRATLRSLHQHAPWVRLVHLVADGAVPSWVAEHPQLRTVRAARTADGAPVRDRLHLIPGLAEQFVLLPSGSVLGQLTKPHLFFTPFGHARFLRTSPEAGEDPGSSWRRLVEREFDRTVTGGIRPGPQARLRSLSATLADRLPPGLPVGGLEADPLDCLHHYWAYAEGRALPGEARSIALHAAAPDLDARLVRLLARRDTPLLHFTGLTDPHTPAGAAERVRHLLDTFFPVHSPFETAPAEAIPAETAPAASTLTEPAPTAPATAAPSPAEAALTEPAPGESAAEGGRA
ncbi:exopolysaccharide phosphotransferase [Kitasatospora kazusensis]|uniref:Exopolysaccharide phosphotransferase n=1 Tax=Kitasatospora kazusensis TaxID=407974 RepID=A0ABP5LUX6_9ACTN